jgi:MFS family permease
VLEKCDEQILPALYSRVGASLKATPTQLGYITLARAFVQALSSPLAGVSSEFYPRGTVIAAGCCIWATFTTLFACVSSLPLAITLCAVNGLGLALVIPSVQSLTADLNARESRGTAFGSLWLVISLGGMLGALYATNVGAYKPLGMDGWRFVFISVSFASAIVGILNHAFVVDDAYVEKMKRDKQKSDQDGHGQSIRNQIQDIAVQIKGVMKIPTFSLIILQGVVGSVPYASLVFMTLYLQLLGMSDSSASIIVGLYLVGGGLGGLLGGYIGDRIATSFPHHGRILATQFSIGVGIPFSLLLFKGLPAIITGSHRAAVASTAATTAPPMAAPIYAVSVFTFAVLTAWPAPCCNNPIFAEIVPAHQRNLVYSFDRCFEGAVAAFATPLVGYLSESFFGFSGTSEVSGDPAIDAANAHALGNALLVFTIVPWLFAFAVYGGLHITYPRDLERTVDGERKYPRTIELRQGSRQNSGINVARETETLL